jgi:hypothetical protein
VLFQIAAGLKPDGLVGPVTKRKIMAPQFDREKHMHAGSAASPESVFLPTTAVGETVKWALSAGVPGYLSREAVAAELQLAFDTWSPICAVRFEQIVEGSIDPGSASGPEGLAAAQLVVCFDSASDGE